MAIITYPLNNITYDATDAETYLCTRKSGIFSADDNFQINITGTRTVSISPGLAWINNGNFKGKSIVNNDNVDLEIEAADVEFKRKDLIVLRFDAALNKSYFAVKMGTPAADPLPPTVERSLATYELGLYVVNVPPGTISVAIGHIESKLLDEQYCGLMRDGVTGIPTAQLQREAEALFDEIREALGEITQATATADDNYGTPSVDVSIASNATGITLGFDFHNIKGKSAYTTAQEGGFDGTEEEFAARLAKDLSKVRNITFTDTEPTSVAGIAEGEIVAVYE